MAKGPQAPAPPIYQAPPAYQMPQFQAPAAYTAPPDPNSVIPGVLSPNQVMNQGASVESQLPSWLQLNNNPMAPDQLGQYQDNYYQQNISPAIEQMRANLGINGQSSSSFGGAALGQLAGQGQMDKFNAGLNFAQQLFGNQVQGRQSYFSGGPSVSQNQNQADVSRGQNVFAGQQQNANMQNQYNLDSADMANGFQSNAYQGLNNYNQGANQNQNSFAMGNYGNQLGLYGQQMQNSANKTMGLGMLGLGATKLLGGGLGALYNMGSSPNFATGQGSGKGYFGTMGKVQPGSAGSFGGSSIPFA